MGNIYSSFDFRGFILSKVEFADFEECHKILDFDLKLTLIVRRINQGKSPLPESVAKCQIQKDKVFKQMIQLLGKDYKDRNELGGYLEKAGVAKDRINKLLSIYDVKQKRVIANATVHGAFSKAMDLISKKSDGAGVYKVSERLLRTTRYQKSNLISKIVRILVALKSGNDSWAKKLIREVLDSDLEENIFYLQRYYFFSDEHYRTFRDKLLKGLDIIGEKLLGERLFKFFISYLDYAFEDRELSDLRERVGANWSLQEIRLMMNSVNYGWNYPKMWSFVMNRRFSDQEFLKFLNQRLTPAEINKRGKSLASLYRFFVPKDKKRRNSVVKEIGKLTDSRNNYDIYLLLKLLENNNIKRPLYSAYPALKSRNMEYQKKFFTKLLNQGVAVEFCIYNLIKLGVKDEDMLWWLIL